MMIGARVLGIGLALSLCMAAPTTTAEAAGISLKARVQTICELDYALQSSNSAGTSAARLTIFCNSPSGATVSAYLNDGHASGYRLSTADETVIATPGSTVELERYKTAFAGDELVRISQVAGDFVAPTLTFTISLE